MIKYYYVVEIDMGIPYPINEKGQPDKYSDPKKFRFREQAIKWIDRHSYKGMSWHYEIREVF